MHAYKPCLIYIYIYVGATGFLITDYIFYFFFWDKHLQFLVSVKYDSTQKPNNIGKKKVRKKENEPRVNSV